MYSGRMNKYLVTGAAGFIGSHLTEKLVHDGHKVRVLDNLSTGKLCNLPANVEVIIGDVCDAPLVRDIAADVDGIFHLAAVASTCRSNEDWIGTHHINQTGSVNVFDAARINGKTPVVYASSAAVYGNQEAVVLCEGTRPFPQTAYGADKLGSELHAGVAATVHGIPTVGLRFFNVYGPRQDASSPYSGVISIFANKVLSSQSLIIHGDGRQVRDFVYVDDVVKHLIAGMSSISQARSGRAYVYNVCTGSPVSILDLAKALISMGGCDTSICYRPARLGDIRFSLGDPTAATQGLGIRADTKLIEGLGMLYRHLSRLPERDLGLVVNSNVLAAAPAAIGLD